MPDLEPLRSHWYWRPGWRQGRSFYTFHITFPDDSAVARLAAAHAPLLDQLPMFAPIPIRWLHLTVQGIGFTDEVNRNDLDAIIAAAHHRCAQLEPFTVTLGPAIPDPEGLPLPATPVEPLIELRDTLRAAIADIWGEQNVPEAADGFSPHVSLAYTTTAGPAEPVATAITEHGPHSDQFTVTDVSLIELNRDHQQYEWTDVATTRLGAGPGE